MAKINPLDVAEYSLFAVTAVAGVALNVIGKKQQNKNIENLVNEAVQNNLNASK